MKKDPAKVKAELDAETAAIRNKAKREGRDAFYKFDDDTPLTNEEIAEIDAFWGKYSFAYPEIAYKSFETFKNRSGHFSVYHCPSAVRATFFRPNFLDENYRTAFQNKAMLNVLYPDIQHPKVIVRRMKGIYYNTNYEAISLNEAAELCCRHIRERGDLIYKPNLLSGAQGIEILNQEKADSGGVRKILGGWTNTFVVQEMLEQCAFMTALNASSVNTIRITTLIFKGKVYPLAALIRVGKEGSRVDNWHAGGCLLGIDIDSGICNNWYLANDRTRQTVLPCGMDLSKTELKVPNFDLVKKRVVQCHYRNPYIGLISWDVALDKTETPTMLECNFGGEIQIHEIVTGPLFGDLMPELLDEYLLRRFYLRFATDDFICKEYYNHIVIAEYIGSSGVVTVPKTIRKKPVTRVEPSAFKGCKITQFDAPENVMKNSLSAVNAAKSLIAKISTPPRRKKLNIIILDIVQSIYARFILTWDLSDFVGEEM